MKLFTAIAFACNLASARSTPFVAQLDRFSDGQRLPYDDATPDAGRNAENPKHRGQAWVPTSVASYIQTAALGAGRGGTSSIELGIFGSSEARRQATETSSVLPLTTVTGTTDEHVDHLEAGAGPTVPTYDVVAFVFLNTNPDAHFELDGDCVPVVENSLVAFNGGQSKHRTVVNGGEVRLLGPFHAKSMEPVGNCGDPGFPPCPTPPTTTTTTTTPRRATTTTPPRGKSGKGPKSEKVRRLRARRVRKEELEDFGKELKGFEDEED
ncbi:hypothetical protein THAOC_03584 [Thalassiosira oceanica]|uniref:Uncharacterized protein n=2 Tax=Thalassiosira oceanica TaxID=159749 RepID=K0T7K3_THAOC|nr:hypothetical protein THAOC_03584 [Thalassiosira oceanica]|eukprot:EJK74718.1 hypothetical protein THAOC_03584 [Thalassiosira oceanica]